jgi:hypothetical protein
MKLRILAGLLIVCSLAAVSACDDTATSPSEELVRFGAQLLPSSVVPPVSGIEAGGSGSVTITFKVKRATTGAITSTTADFQVTLAGFPVATALTAAHIHRGGPSNNGLAVVDTGLGQGEVVFGNLPVTFTKLGISVAPALAQEIFDSPGGFYFDVHSTGNRDGMARGQLVKQ